MYSSDNNNNYYSSSNSNYYSNNNVNNNGDSNQYTYSSNGNSNSNSNQYSYNSNGNNGIDLYTNLHSNYSNPSNNPYNNPYNNPHNNIQYNSYSNNSYSNNTFSNNTFSNNSYSNQHLMNNINDIKNNDTYNNDNKPSSYINSFNSNSNANSIDSSGKLVYRVAVQSTIICVMSAMAFALLIYFIKGKQSSLEFLAGYLVEQSLSIDNLFFFVMLFNYFKVPLMYQNRVLKWGIIGAIVLRGIMIYWGIRLAENFKIVTLIFAIVLIVSSFKMLKNEEDDDNDLDNNYIMKISKRFMKTSDHYDGDKFFTVIDNTTVATPLLLCLVCVELSDLVFAIDSIPAVLGVSHDSLIVYSSNIFAIMGLRSLYTLIAKAVADMPFIKTAIGLILGFVGIKMVFEYTGYSFLKISTGCSLLVVFVLLFGGMLLSILSKSTPLLSQYIKNNNNDKKSKYSV